MIIATLLSFLTLGVFIVLGVSKFGLLPSYSAYASKWEDVMPMTNTTHLWSLVTFAAAYLLVPVMIVLGEGNLAQCLGFFVPLYLMGVSLTPDWETKAVQHRVHTAFAVLCAAANVLWICLVCQLWWLLLIVAPAVAIVALLDGSLWSAKVFWGEMAMFLSAYLSIIFSLI